MGSCSCEVPQGSWPSDKQEPCEDCAGCWAPSLEGRGRQKTLLSGLCESETWWSEFQTNSACKYSCAIWCMGGRGCGQWQVGSTRQEGEGQVPPLHAHGYEAEDCPALYVYDFLQMKPETAKDFIKTFAERWLGIFPKPKALLLDSAKSFSSEETLDFLSGLNILVHYTAEKESWAHGAVEAAVQDFKTTASAIFLENLTLEPETALHLTTSALNSTDHQLEPRTDFTRLIVAR